MSAPSLSLSLSQDMSAYKNSYAAISQHEPFKHENLQLSENFMRLFRITSGKADEPISLSITQYSISRRPKYVAISYTWGSATNLHTILVNGRSFQIHSNLWNLLFQLRRRQEKSFFWADRMCIDQENLSERNFHVRFMGNIYEQASSVVVWLGAPSPDRAEIRAMEFVKDIIYLARTHTPDRLSKVLLDADIQHRWQTLLRMCRHCYWSRTWIIQEFIKASQIEVLCGSAGLQWADFEQVLEIVQQVPYDTEQAIVALLQSRPARLTLRRRSQVLTTLYELIHEYHDSRCTERRDKIYGILGLASDCGRPSDVQATNQGVKADYKKHIVEVYLEVVECIAKFLPHQSLIPSAANLTRRALLLTHHDVQSYAANISRVSIRPSILKVVPSYCGTIRKMLTWSSSSDMRQKLEQTDWGEYVGYDVNRARPGIGRRSSTRIVHSSLPDDFIQNAINAAELEDFSSLYECPSAHDLCLPTDFTSQSPLDKRHQNDTTPEKPRLLIEQSPTSTDLRVGFTCSNTRVGDRILQFQGLDIALVVREIGIQTKLIGKAVLIKHSQLQREGKLDTVCEPSPWFSPCPIAEVVQREEMVLETDALSLAELVTR